VPSTERKRTMKTAVMGVMWAGRATVFLVGLAVTLAVMIGVATAALGAVPGDPFKLGRINTIGRITQLVGSTNNAMLRIDNNSKGPDATALELEVDPKKPPIRTNSLTKVENLHADLLDGRSASQFANGVGGTAVDADNLDGKDSTAFVPVDTYSVVDSRPGQGGGQIASRGARCDSGDMVLNGGYSSGPDDNLLASGPDGTRDWFAAVQDNGLDSLIKAEAICADFPPLR
jgi:uncharacterized membrane protein YgcG